MKVILIFLVVLFSGCYNQRKAAQQVQKADTSYPEIIAKLCAEKFPVIEKIIKGDSILVTDTLWGEGIIINDTTVIRDTVRIVKTVPKVVTITKTVHITDTVKIENKAALKACEINRDNAISLALDKTAEAVKWKQKAKNRFWVLTGIGAASLLLLGLWVRRKVKK